MSAAARSNVIPFPPHGHDGGSCAGLADVRERVGKLEDRQQKQGEDLAALKAQVTAYAALGGGLGGAAIGLVLHFLK